MKKTTHRKCESIKRHKASEELKKKSSCTLESCATNTWRMESLTSKGIFYVLEQLKQDCNCPLHCSMYSACAHMYSCTCLDATLHSTVCKHIHLLCIQRAKETEKYSDTEQNNSSSRSEKDDDVSNTESNKDNDISNNESDDVSDNDDMEAEEQQYNTHEYFFKLLNSTDNSKDCCVMRNDVSKLAHELESLTQSCHDANILKTVKKSMQSAISLLNVNCSSGIDATQNKDIFKPTKRIAPNSNQVNQLRFFRPKKEKN